MEAKEFTNIDKNVLDECLNEEIIKCASDDKLLKRAMVSSLGEIITTLDEIDKGVKVVQHLITIAYKDDIDGYFKRVAKAVKEEEKQQKQNNIDNQEKIN
jgi:ribosomal protein L17